MARKRKGNPVHGWVIVDKAAGQGSTPCVGAVRRAFNAQKAGHGGTLDPFATGLLPIALGEATKTVAYVMDGEKSYRFTLRFGELTDTLDIEGEVTETSDRRPAAADILAVLPEFIGEISQMPPVFSALKVDGKRAYDLARAGEEVKLEPRQVTIHDLRLVEMPDADHGIFEVDCGKGTYVRALGRDIAARLDTVGHLTTLRRTRVGPFTEKDAISLEEVQEKAHNPADKHVLLPIEAALDGIPALALTEAEAIKLRNGQAVSLLRKVDLDRISGLGAGDTVVAVSGGKAVALARYEKGAIQPVRVLIQ